jgi:DNA topoisomerase-3
VQSEEGKWRVEFDEPWARDGAKPPEQDESGAGEAETPATGAQAEAA